ncbi:MAG: LysM peptidoglycan-binding domain-containing protein [Thermoflexales bacterium]|nr:LysM peptidoglycan-binding domain-containing protein [Thermoflexales bacterium]
MQVNDTLSALGQSTGISVEEIQRANCLAGTMIFSGQPLYLPFVPPPPVVAIVTAPPPIPATPPPPGPGDPTIAVNPESGPPGTTFVFQLDHFKSNEHITVRIVAASTFAVVYQSDLMVDTLGYLLVLYPSPLDVAVGAYAVNIIGTSSAASGQFTITNPP